MRNSRSFIAIVSITHITLIIFLQKKDKNCDVCDFQLRLWLFILLKKQILIARTITGVINRSTSG